MRLGAAVLALAACGLPFSAIAQSAADGEYAMLAALSGFWAGHGTVKASRSGGIERVDCTLLLDWRQDIGRLEHTLSCRGTGSGVQASGYFDVVASTNQLTGFVNGSSIIGRARAICELKGRALYITLTPSEHDPRDALGDYRAERSLWILLLNRGGDRRLGTVIRARDKTGGNYNKLAVNMRRIERRTDASQRPEDVPETTSGPQMSQPLDGRAVIER